MDTAVAAKEKTETAVRTKLSVAGRITHEIQGGLVWRRAKARTPRAAGTIFYIHGLGESGLCFEGLMRRAELRGWDHLAPDLPGYGKSPWGSRPLVLGELAAALGGRLERLSQGGRVVVVGHSMGGVVGQLVCEASRNGVDGFVNVEGNISLEDCTFSGQVARSTLVEFVDAGFAGLCDRVYEMGRGYLPARSYHASLRLADPVQFHANSKELVELSAREDLGRRFAALATPTKLFVAGLRGGLGRRSMQLLQEAGVEVTGFEDSGHWPFLDEEERFAKLLEKALG